MLEPVSELNTGAARVDDFAKAWSYALSHTANLEEQFLRHLFLVGVALAISTLICVPLGVLTSRRRWLSAATINLFNTLRVLPSLAILFVFISIPGFGLSVRSALVALTVLACPPILINTNTAFRTIDRSIREAAFGMGMAPRQVLWRVELPLALPVMIAGIRTALIEVIASATLAAFIGAGGLGHFINLGFAQRENSIMLVGAVPVALLAIAGELLMNGLQCRLQPRQAA